MEDRERLEGVELIVFGDVVSFGSGEKDGDADVDARIQEISGKNAIALKDVLIGEVRICSGQSNMEWGLGGTMNAKAVKIVTIKFAETFMFVFGYCFFFLLLLLLPFIKIAISNLTYRYYIYCIIIFDYLECQFH